MKTSVDYEDLSRRLFERAYAKSGLSQRELAKRMRVTPGTIKNWLSGYSFPSLPDLLRLFAQMDVAPLRSFLEMVYPEEFEGLSEKSSVDEMRKALLVYIEKAAPDSEIRINTFNKFGPHGSSISGQANLSAAYNHLPLEDRIAISKMIMHFYSIRQRQGQLVCADSQKPDVGVIVASIQAAMDAVCSGQSAYSNLMPEGAVSDSDTDKHGQT